MAELKDEDIEFIQELRKAREQGHINRRQALGLLAGVGIGGAAGALGTGAVKADASTSDSDGNVGLPGDRVDVFGDGVDAVSLSAEDLSFSDTPVGSLKTFEDVIEGSSSGIGRAFQFTDGVGTSATAIYSRPTSNTLVASLVYIYGIEQGSANNSFTDLVNFHSFNAVNVISSTTRSGGGSRSYSVDGADLDLAMGSGTHNVVAIGLGVQTNG
jgi:hypothetical protein